MKSFIFCGMVAFCTLLLCMEEKKAIMEEHFDTVRIYYDRTKPWTKIFHDLKGFTRDEFALRVLGELKKSFCDENYVLTDFACIVMLSQSGKSLISHDTKKITKEVFEAFKAGMPDKQLEK